MWFSGGMPTVAFIKLRMAWRWLKRAFTTGLPGGTSGALMRKLMIFNVKLTYSFDI
jgi:hypothetical protein